MTSNAPDLGLSYLEAGRQHAELSFRHVRFEQLSRIGPKLYSICVNLTAEVVYAVSFDLDASALDQLLNCIPPAVADFVRENFAADIDGPMMLNLPSLTIDLTARLGEPQQGDGETFVPFVVKTVSRASDMAAIDVTDDPNDQ